MGRLVRFTLIAAFKFHKILFTIKQIVLNIKEGKFQFFMELVRSLDFVQIDDDGDSKEAILSNIKKGLEEVKLARQGKLKTTPAKDFLNEL